MTDPRLAFGYNASPDLLHPHSRGQFLDWILECGELGMDLLVYCTVRTLEEQAGIWRRSRSAREIDIAVKGLFDLGMIPEATALRESKVLPKSGDFSTNAKPGYSFHNPKRILAATGALAVDFVPLIGGKANWKDAQTYLKAGELAERHGLSWSGRWTGKLKETAHVQWDDHGKLRDPKTGGMHPLLVQNKWI